MVAKAKAEKPPKVEKPKVDLFKALDRLNAADVSFFNGLTSDEKKSLAPVVIMRWLSCTKDKKQIVHLNHLVNPLVFNMYQQPELLFKLMMASCSGTPKRFQWIKKASLNKKQPTSIEIIKRFYQCSTLEAKRYIQLHTIDDIIEMAGELGEDSTLIEKLKKE